MLKRLAWGRKAFLVSTGMLLYSVVASPGYFAQQGQWALVGMFGVLLLMALWSAFAVARDR
jgi:uncharacterized membrane protein